MEDTDNDSVLMLRQMYLTSLAYKGLGQLTVPQVGSSFLEHPARALHHSLIKFDECRLVVNHGIVNGPSSPPLAPALQPRLAPHRRKAQLQ